MHLFQKFSLTPNQCIGQGPQCAYSPPSCDAPFVMFYEQTIHTHQSCADWWENNHFISLSMNFISDFFNNEPLKFLYAFSLIVGESAIYSFYCWTCFDLPTKTYDYFSALMSCWCSQVMAQAVTLRAIALFVL